MVYNVSVVIPIYNVSKYIERCARSLFEQTLDNIEYLFVNDCTPDESIEILQRVLRDYPNKKEQVKIINQPRNMGAAKAREVGIKNALGKYIIQCDSDDWVDKDMYRRMYEKAAAENLDAVLCRSLYYTDGTNHSLVEDCIPDNKNEFIVYILRLKTSVSLCNRLVRRNIYFKNDFIFPQQHMMEDTAYAVQLAHYCDKVGCVEGPFYYYYQNSNSICGLDSEEACIKRCLQSHDNVQIIINFIEQHNLYDKYSIYLVRLKFIVKCFLFPLLKKNLKHRKLWIQTFPEVNYKLWLSKEITWSLKVISFLVIIGFYPCICLLNQRVRKIKKQ